MNKHLKSTIVFCVIYTIFISLLLVLLMPCANADIAQPILQTTKKLTNAGLKIGKGIATVSFLITIILFIIGRPQWKWSITIMVGAGFLSAFQPVVSWIIA